MWSFKQYNRIIPYYFFLALMLSVFSCSTLKTPSYNDYSYQETIKIKDELLQLIDLSSNATYTEHQAEISTILNRIETLKKHEKNRPYNTITVDMWNQLSGENNHLITDYFAFWKRKKILSPHFATQAKKQMASAFEILLTYELQKTKE